MKYLLIFMLNVSIFAQNKLEMKEITKENFDFLHTTKKGIQLNIVPLNNSIYFFLESNKSILKFDIIEEKYYFQDDGQEFLMNLNEIDKESLVTPLYKYREILPNIEVHKESLINDFLKEISETNGLDYRNIDLKLIDKKIKDYGLKKIYDNFFLNLILFCGEYAIYKDNGNGGWLVESSHFYPSEYTIKYVDKKNKIISIQGIVKEYLYREYRDEDENYIDTISGVIEVLNINIFE